MILFVMTMHAELCLILLYIHETFDIFQAKLIIYKYNIITSPFSLLKIIRHHPGQFCGILQGVFSVNCRMICDFRNWCKLS